MIDVLRQPRRILRALRRLASDPAYRGEWRARLKPAPGTFQPFGATRPDRYPVIFRCAAQLLPAATPLRLLSFGCSTGEEVFTLRTYFPHAQIKGVDINPASIKVAARRLARAPDPRLAFAVADSTAPEAAASTDAIFCMAVLRHGGLTDAARCDPLLDFADFARITADFARCLRPGGLLVLRHSNFRFADAPAYAGFEVAARVPTRGGPLFGPDNRRLPGAVYDETIFRKRTS